MQVNIDNDKRQLINYLYSTIELSNFKYKLLKEKEDLQQLDVDKFVVSANFSGPTCLLIFIKIKDKYYSHLIDKKTLSFNVSQINFTNLRTTRIRVGLDQSIYKGSIFDGILIQQGINKTFLITDCYQFRGQKFINDNLTHKLINIRSYLGANYNDLDKTNTIKLYVNKVYDLSEINKLISVDIPKTKNMNISGITFYPNISGVKLIFLFNQKQDQDIFTQKQEQSQPHTQSHTPSHTPSHTQPHTPQYTFQQTHLPYQHQHQQHQLYQQQQHQPYQQQQQTQDTVKKSIELKKKVNVSYVAKSDEPIVVTLEIRKTDVVDVYKLYAVEKIAQNDKVIHKSKKMGIAYIPTRECSILCKTITAQENRIYVDCKFIQDKNKWQPLEQNITCKIPTLINVIEKQLDIIEDSVSDSE